MRNSNVLLKVCILIFTCSVLLNGCGKSDAEKYYADKNTIFVKSDASVIGTVADTLDKEHYDISELEEFIDDKILEYNYNVLTEAVSILSFTAEGNDVRLIMKYTSAEHYNDFNQEEFYIGSVAEAMDAGYMFETAFVDYKELKEAAIIDVTGNTALNVLIMEPSDEMVISLPGKVSYISSHVTPIDKKTVQIPKDCRSYVIYD